jgi:hypothetical protein
MIRETFTGEGDFEASEKAEAWCRERGLSVGRMDRFDMRGILLGKFDIAKWHNLSHAHRMALHGVMSGDMRRGPVHVDLKPAIYQQVTAKAAAA